jgi:hypothetical protein
MLRDDDTRDGVNVLMPQYEKDKRLGVLRETNEPPASTYIGLGWDETPDQKRRHYRKFYMTELENNERVIRSKPFNEYIIVRGETRGNGAPAAFLGDSVIHYDEKIVGRFKGIVRVHNRKEKLENEEKKKITVRIIKKKINELCLKMANRKFDFDYKLLESEEGRLKFKHKMEDLGLGELKIGPQITSLTHQDHMAMLLNTKTDCMIKLYVISAFNLASRDIGSDSDPYLKIKFGKTLIDEREEYQLDEPNPVFCKSYTYVI